MPWTQDWPTGSTYTNGSGADVDIVRFTEDPQATRADLLAAGFTLCNGDESYSLDGDTFFAVRKDLLNIIVVWDYLLYLRWVAFSEVAARIGTLDKVERIALSQALVEGNAEQACNIVRTPAFHKEAGILSFAQHCKSSPRR